MPGWAPFGCPPKQRIDDVQAKQVLADLTALLPAHLHSQCKGTVLVPFATNHQLCIAVEGGQRACREVADALQQKIVEKSYKVKGFVVKASVETSPSRKSDCRLFYSACEYLVREKVPEQNIKLCQKGLKIYDSRSFELVGQAKAGVWVWTAALDEIAGRSLRDTVADGNSMEA